MKFNIVNEQVKDNCLEEIKAIDVNDKKVVKIMTAQESRSEAQSRLRWLWAGQAAKELAGVGKGRDKMEWNLYWKATFMRPLLIEQDTDYEIFFEDYDDHCELLKDNPVVLKNYQYHFWELIARTEEMKVKTFSEFLKQIEQYMLHEWQLALKTPDDLRYAL